MCPCRRRCRMRRRCRCWHSWDHAAFEHLVGDRCRDFVDELGAQLRIAAQQLDGFLFHSRFRLAFLLSFLLPQLFAGRLLVLLDDLVSDHVQEPVLGASDADEQQRGHHHKQEYTLGHGSLLISWYSGYAIALEKLRKRLVILPRYRPSIVSVASGDPGTPVICWAKAGAATGMTATMNARIVGRTAVVFITFSCSLRCINLMDVGKLCRVHIITFLLDQQPARLGE